MSQTSDDNTNAATQDAQPADSGNSQTATASAVTSCRLPTFWSSNPRLWIAQAESEFVLKGIRAETTKYHLVIRAMSERDIIQISDIVRSPPTASPYQRLRGELLRRFEPSASHQLQRLLSTEELGDSTPTQFLRRLYALLGDEAQSFSEACLRELFLQRLPQTVRSLLVASQVSNLPDLAALGDRIMDDTGRVISTVEPDTHPQERSDLNLRLQALETSLEALRSEIAARPRSASPQTGYRLQRSSPRLRRPSPRRGTRREASPPPAPTYCWYHFRFGASARQCRPPCQWAGNASADR